MPRTKKEQVVFNGYIQTAPTILQKMSAGLMRLSTKTQKKFITERLEKSRALDLLKPQRLKSGLRPERQRAHLMPQKLMYMQL